MNVQGLLCAEFCSVSNAHQMDTKLPAQLVHLAYCHANHILSFVFWLMYRTFLLDVEDEIHQICQD